MGNKERRQTKKDRKLQAKARRLEEVRRLQRRATMRKGFLIFLVLAALGGIVAAAVNASKEGRKSRARLNEVAVAAGCDKLEGPALEGAQHVEGDVSYGTTPPTSGNHHGSGTAPAATGIHKDPIADEDFVHNLEHGHVGILYDGIDKAHIDALRKVTRGEKEWTFMAPYPSLKATGYQVAFNAWGKLMRCKSPTSVATLETVAAEFVRQQKDKAVALTKESIPCNARVRCTPIDES